MKPPGTAGGRVGGTRGESYALVLLPPVPGHIALWEITQGWEEKAVLVGGDWNHGMDYDFPFSWEFHDPN